MFQEVIIYNYNSQENQSIELAYTTFVIKNGRKLPLSYNKMLHAIKRRDTITMLFPFFFYFYGLNYTVNGRGDIMLIISSSGSCLTLFHKGSRL